jgi:predicted ArsR family transcriptional regulator
MNLFEYADTRPYPVSPGWKGTDTSRAAAESIPASILRGKVLRIYQLRGACTADEVAEALHMSVLSVRPRVTELKSLGKIVDTGIRRPNRSGRSAAVMKVIAP